jgi:hypothetical protein
VGKLLRARLVGEDLDLLSQLEKFLADVADRLAAGVIHEDLGSESDDFEAERQWVLHIYLAGGGSIDESGAPDRPAQH